MVYTGDDDFDWDEANVNKVRAHGIEPWEAEEVVLSGDRISVDAYTGTGEQRFAVIGRTDAGRLLRVVLTRRDRRLRVVTAHEPGARDRRRWSRSRRRR
jgi:uncharacterized DUF497 family protein